MKIVIIQKKIEKVIIIQYQNTQKDEILSHYKKFLIYFGECKKKI